MNIPLKVGQEWRIKDDKYSTYLIAKINPVSTEIALVAYSGKNVCKTYDYSTPISPTDSNRYWLSPLWIYVGEPMVCEYCKEFCRQLCKVKIK